jgi:hypothetical protein
MLLGLVRIGGRGLVGGSKRSVQFGSIVRSLADRDDFLVPRWTMRTREPQIIVLGTYMFLRLDNMKCYVLHASINLATSLITICCHDGLSMVRLGLSVFCNCSWWSFIVASAVMYIIGDSAG